MAVLAVLQISTWRQNAAAPGARPATDVAEGSDFAPLTQWKAAVMAGTKQTSGYGSTKMAGESQPLAGVMQSPRHRGA
jgi:hypothetical protein